MRHFLMLASIFLIFMVAPPQSAVATFERITPQEAAKRVSKCGLGRVTIRYEPDLQEEVLVASEATQASDKQLGCADEAAGYYGLVLPTNVQARYEALRRARLGKLLETDARAWLTARGLLNQVPKYQEGITGDAAFTRQVERLCGPQAEGAFQSTFGFHALSPDWIKRELNPLHRGSDTLFCLLNVTTVAGFQVGFIGNEAYHR